MENLPPKTVRIWRYELPGEIPALQTLNDEINKLPEFTALVPRLQYALQLAIEEIVSNTIKYGYREKETLHIMVELIFCGQRVDVKLVDDGHKFNPIVLDSHPHDGSDVDQLPVGGVGILLAKNFTANMNYRYEGNQNILEFTISN